MHLLLTAIGSYGDVHPMIALGAAMRERGHDVTLLTNPHFADEVAAAGIEGEYVSSVEEYDEVTSHRDIWQPRRGVALVLRWGVERLLRPMHERLAALYRPGETLIAAHALDVASRVAADSLRAPVVRVVFAPMALCSVEQPSTVAGVPLGPGWPRWWNAGGLWLADKLAMRRVIRAPIEAFRREFDLPPIAGRLLPDWWFGAGPSLGLFPDWFVDADGRLPSDWPDGLELTGFPLWGAANDETLPDGLDAWLAAGDPPIVFTPGSANRAAAAFFAAAVDACRRTGRRGLLLTKYAEQLHDAMPESVRHESFVPLGAVLSRAAAFVHHGGIGSSAQGLAAGVPQLIHPMAFDQPDNAARLTRLGVASSITPRRFTGPRVAAELDRLLGSSQVRAASSEGASRCDANAARTRACEFLERALSESSNT